MKVEITLSRDENEECELKLNNTDHDNIIELVVEDEECTHGFMIDIDELKHALRKLSTK
jgi:hypothetical protein